MSQLDLSSAPPASGKPQGVGVGPELLPPGLGPAHPIVKCIRRLQSQEDLARLIEASAQDNHRPICPTHLLEREGEILGYASIGCVPMVFCWVDSRKVRARQSFALLAQAEQLAAAYAPVNVICVPCTAESPFAPFMGRLGYHQLGEAMFLVKNLKAKANVSPT